MLIISQYILTKAVLGRLRTREAKRLEGIQKRYKNPILQCKKCDEDLKVGDVLIAPKNSANSKRYHLRCAKQLNLI